MWYSWGEATSLEGGISGHPGQQHRLCSTSGTGSHYRSTLLDIVEVPDEQDVGTPPIPVIHVDTIWKTFLKNVHPLVKIFFDWEVEPLMQKAGQDDSQLSGPEVAFVSAIAFLTIVSVPKEECVPLLQEEKSTLLDRYQRITERALLRVGYAITSNKHTLQAFMLYLVSLMLFSSERCL